MQGEIQTLSLLREAEKFHKTRKWKYQPFMLAGRDFPGKLYGSAGKPLVREVSLSEQLNYLNFEQLPWKDSTVLDIGCNIGSMCLEALRRGASKVYGVDQDISCVEDAVLLRDLAQRDGIDTSKWLIKKKSFFEVDDTYDAVIFLAVLHHCSNQMRALEKIRILTEKFCLIEAQLWDPSLKGEELTLQGMQREIPRRKRGSMFGLGYYPSKETLIKALEMVGFRDLRVVGEGKISSRLVIHAFPG